MSESKPQEEPKMSEFVFLYRGGVRPDSPDLMQQMIQKWMTWLKDLGAKGHLRDPGRALELTGKLVRGRQKSVTDGPYAETKDIVAGYSVVQAKDIAEAVEFSLGCPIFDTGGIVEVRPVMKT
jgi:hypothetical protein